MDSAPRLDVVIVAYRNETTIQRCVESVNKVAGVGKVIVVDHGDDATATLAARTGASVVGDLTNPGFGAGQNRGVALTGAPFVLLLNPDATVEPAALAQGVKLMVAEPGIGAVQGAIVNPDSGRLDRSQGMELTSLHLWGRVLGARRLSGFGLVRQMASRLEVFADHVDRRPTGPSDVSWLAATALLVRRSAFDAVGGFDETYFMYGEDLDLCRRLRVAGWRLVALPCTWAWHHNGASASSWWERELQWWEGTMAFAARWWRGWPWVSAILAATLRSVTLAVRRPWAGRSTVSALVGRPMHRHRRRTGPSR